MKSYCLSCRKLTSGNFLRRGVTTLGRPYSIFKCDESGRKKSVFQKQTGGIVWSRNPELPNSGYKGYNGILRAYEKRIGGNRQKGNGFDIQKWIAKTGIEFHPPDYQFLGPGTHLKKRLALSQKGINRLDRIARN